MFFSDSWNKRNFSNDPKGDSLLYVSLVAIKHSNNIIVDNCKIYNAGTDPVIIASSHHVTVARSHEKGSYNKGGKGNGYFNIDKGSHHLLVKHNRIEKLRHLAIQNGAHHNVIFDNYLEVDVNFHNGDAGYNLVERNTIRIPEWHGWHVFSRGAKNKHLPPGPHNYLYNNLTQYKLFIPELRERITQSGDSIIYASRTAIDTVYIKNKPLIKYSYGPFDLDKSRLHNKLYLMTDSWEAKKATEFHSTLEEPYLYMDPTKN